MKQHRERTALSTDNAHHSLILKAAIIWERSAKYKFTLKPATPAPSSMNMTESSFQERVH